MSAITLDTVITARVSVTRAFLVRLVPSLIVQMNVIGKDSVTKVFVSVIRVSRDRIAR